jgi:hypothetical protein
MTRIFHADAQTAVQYPIYLPVFFSRNVFRAEHPLLASVFARRDHHKVLCIVDSVSSPSILLAARLNLR